METCSVHPSAMIPENLTDTWCLFFEIKYPELHWEAGFEAEYRESQRDAIKDAWN